MLLQLVVIAAVRKAVVRRARRRRAVRNVLGEERKVRYLGRERRAKIDRRNLRRGGKVVRMLVSAMWRHEGAGGCRTAQERELMSGWAREIMGFMPVREGGSGEGFEGKRIGEVKGLEVRIGRCYFFFIVLGGGGGGRGEGGRREEWELTATLDAKFPRGCR